MGVWLLFNGDLSKQYFGPHRATMPLLTNNSSDHQTQQSLDRERCVAKADPTIENADTTGLTAAAKGKNKTTPPLSA